MNKKTFFRTIKINVESFILLLTTIHNCLCLRRKKNIGFENHKWEQENKNLKIETGKKKSINGNIEKWERFLIFLEEQKIGSGSD